MTASKQTQVQPRFDLQRHHDKIDVPQNLDMVELSRRYSIFPLKIVPKNGRPILLLAMRDVKNAQAIRDAEFKAGMNVLPVEADEIDIQWLIQKHYYGRPLSPTPSTKAEDITHDVFDQLTLTSDMQARPAWVTDLRQENNPPSEILGSKKV